ncbi:DUF6174 domain-containing protein [uncultured Paraglaciecola sp.]|uniref:DUF6174 domain-containing protein n=1 Tax=uncultured Paraglaciecola sp. TaxID=1765024 RepID=UPI0026282B64|nr:DUF6174 domain-containing protein [uncultured Paraglaciecola sp.]
MINLETVSNKVFLVAVAFFALVVISGCNSSEDVSNNNEPSDLASLQSAKALWQSTPKQFYSIQSRRSCECLDEVTTLMQVSVYDNEVLSAINVNTDEAISKDIQQEIKTVDALFTAIENAISDGVLIEVIYNEEFGYPETAKLDLEQLAVDGGLHITMSDLQVKDSLLELEDVTWSLASFDSIAGPQPIIDNTYISLSFDMGTMQVKGVAGCNHYSADFVLDKSNNNLTISNVTSTEMACSEPENIMEQEQNYLATLAQVQFFSFDKTSMNMVVGGDAGLHFVLSSTQAELPEPAPASNELAALLSAKAIWNSQAAQHYSIQSQRSCECVDEAAAPMQVNVLDNSVLSAVDINSDEAISKEIRAEIQTVDNLFVLIEQAISDGISINVIYNKEYGYPETTQIDLEQIAVDGGLHVNLSNFEIKDTQSALDDVTWRLESFDSIAGPLPVIENSILTMSIDMINMQITGMGGCNSYSADFVISDKGRSITISNLISTDMACDAPENLMMQEQSYFSTLEQIRFFNLHEASLNMVVGGDAGLHFVPEY